MVCPVCFNNKIRKVHSCKENGIFVNDYKCKSCNSRWKAREYIDIVTINTKERTVKYRQFYILEKNNTPIFKGTGSDCVKWLDIDIFAFHNAVSSTRVINDITITPEEEYVKKK